MIIEIVSHSEIRELEQNVKEAEVSVERKDFQNIIRCETEFHDILYKSMKSEVFFQTISGIIDKFQWLRAIALNAQGGAHQSIDDYKKMLKALKKMDGTESKNLLNCTFNTQQRNMF